MPLITRHRNDSWLTKARRYLLEGYQRLIELPGAWKTVLGFGKKWGSCSSKEAGPVEVPARTVRGVEWSSRTSRIFGPLLRFKHWEVAPSWLNLNLVLVPRVGKNMASGCCPTKLWVRSHFSKGTRVLLENEWVLDDPRIHKCEIDIPCFPFLYIKLIHSNSMILRLCSLHLRGWQFFSPWGFIWQLPKTKWLLRLERSMPITVVSGGEEKA